MYPTPLKYSPMTVRTESSSSQPSWGLSPPMKPWVPVPVMPKQCLSPSSPIPTLPSHGANVPTRPWPVLFSMETPNAQGLVSLQMCPALLPVWRQGDQHWMKSPALLASTLIPELSSLQGAVCLCLSLIHCEKYNAYEQSNTINLTRSIVFPLFLTENK